MKKSMKTYDRAEFTNAVIGWLGDENVFKDLLRLPKRQINKLISSSSEELENKIAEKISQMSIEELNQLCAKYMFDCEVIEIYSEPLEIALSETKI